MCTRRKINFRFCLFQALLFGRKSMKCLLVLMQTICYMEFWLNFREIISYYKITIWHFSKRSQWYEVVEKTPGLYFPLYFWMVLCFFHCLLLLLCISLSYQWHIQNLFLDRQIWTNMDGLLVLNYEGFIWICLIGTIKSL